MDEDGPQLPVELQQMLDELPEPLQQRVGQLVSLTVASSHSGPLPSPKAFAAYERIRPGSADDIMRMALEEQAIKKSTLGSRLSNERLTIGVAMAGIIGLAVVSLVSLWLDQPYVAGLTGLASAVLLMVRTLPRRKD